MGVARVDAIVLVLLPNQSYHLEDLVGKHGLFLLLSLGFSAASYAASYAAAYAASYAVDKFPLQAIIETVVKS